MGRTVNCSNCNAPLPLDVSRPTLHCDYCKSDVINPAYAAPGAPRPATGSRAGLIIGVMLAVFLLGGVGLLATLCGGGEAPPAAPAVAPAGPVAAPRPAEPAPDQFLAAEDLTGDGIADLAFGSSCRPDAAGLEECGVGLLDGKDGKLAWHRTYLSSKASRRERLACHGVLVVQDNTRSIVGHEGGSGAERWRLTLSDFIRFPGLPAGTRERPVCLFATEDHGISAVDARAGKLLWRREGTTWGLRDVEVGADAVYFGDAESLFVDLRSGKPLQTGIKSARHLPPPLRPRLSLAGGHAYQRPPRGSELLIHRTAGWNRVAALKEARLEDLGMYPLGDRLLLLQAFRPPGELAVLEGSRLTGPVTVAEAQAIAQVRAAGDLLLLLTVTSKGTQRTTLRVYDRKLKELWNAELDASGLAYQFLTPGPSFGGLGGRSSGNAVVAATEELVLLEMGPAARGRISVRELRTGKVLGEVAPPLRQSGLGLSGLEWIHTGPRRAFIRYQHGSAVVALDLATRKLLWSYP